MGFYGYTRWCLGIDGWGLGSLHRWVLLTLESVPVPWYLWSASSRKLPRAREAGVVREGDRERGGEGVRERECVCVSDLVEGASKV